MRYYCKTADFNDGVCLIKNVTKGLDAIKKTRDLMLNMHSDKLREGFKKQFAGAKTLKVQGSWIKALMYKHIVNIVKNKSTRSYAKTPNVTADYSAAEIEVADEMVRVVSSAENPDTFRKYRRYWKFQHDLRVEYSMTEQESSFREGLARFLLFKTLKFHRRFFNKTTNALSTIKRWNRVYYCYIEELATRVIAEKKGYFSSQTNLQQVDVRVALLHVALAYWVGGS